MTIAMIGSGTSFLIGDGATPEVFTAIAEVFAVTPPNMKRDSVDVTHMASTARWREFIPGLLDAGEVSIQLNFDPGGAQETALFVTMEAGAPGNFKITWPDATAWTFSAFMTGFSTEDPIDGRVTATATFKLTSRPAFIEP